MVVLKDVLNTVSQLVGTITANPIAARITGWAIAVGTFTAALAVLRPMLRPMTLLLGGLGAVFTQSHSPTLPEAAAATGEAFQGVAQGTKKMAEARPQMQVGTEGMERVRQTFVPAAAQKAGADVAGVATLTRKMDKLTSAMLSGGGGGATGPREVNVSLNIDGKRLANQVVPLYMKEKLDPRSRI